MVGVSLAWLQLLAAALDVLENEGLIRLIRANPNQPNPDLVMFTAVYFRVELVILAFVPHGENLGQVEFARPRLYGDLLLRRQW